MIEGDRDIRMGSSVCQKGKDRGNGKSHLWIVNGAPQIADPLPCAKKQPQNSVPLLYRALILCPR